MNRLLKVSLDGEHDIVAARQSARHLTRLLEVEYQDQIRITTAVSEFARAAMSDQGGACAEFLLKSDEQPQLLVIRVTGPGLRRAEGQQARSTPDPRTLSAYKLLARFDADPTADDTVSVCRPLPKRAAEITAARADRIRTELEALHATHAAAFWDEIKQQTRELSTTLVELERKQEELATLNAELADTNRGVMALYAELDERANHLRHADELKTKFFSNMSHEFRTPLNSIQALATMLLDEADGPLGAEQARQVRLIYESASEMLDVVGDLLDLAKVEAGKTSVTIAQFSVATLFGALRGMVRPLLRSSSVALDFDSGAGLPPMVGDEAKITQILRNFLSNAVKFTERGSITVTAELLRKGDRPLGLVSPVSRDSILFCVTDTGIGISRTDQEIIFEEFMQVRHSLQRTVRGTGLGLPLCRKLASLLGGQVFVSSELGVGSQFCLLVPRSYRPAVAAVDERLDAAKITMPLLVVSDVGAHHAALQTCFQGSLFSVTPARVFDVTDALLAALTPAATVVDFSTGGGGTSGVIERIRRARVPLVLVSADADPQSAAPNVHAFSRDLVTAAYREALRSRLNRVLLVDDDQAFRFILGKSVEAFCAESVATGDAQTALATASGGDIDCAVLDLMMPDIDGLELLTLLRDDAVTSNLPVLVCSSKALSSEESALLRQMGAAFLPKSDLQPERLARGLVEACLGARMSAPPASRTWTGERG